MKSPHYPRPATCFSLICLILSRLVCAANATEWFVAPDGKPENAGTTQSPWDLESTLRAAHSVEPGDIVWLAAGTYRHPDRKFGAMGFEVRLAGTESKPVHVRARRGERVTIDGGLNVIAPATHLWLSDLEIVVSENLTMPRRIEESGSHPESYNRPWGGLNIYSGTQCKFIDLIIHDNAQGVSWWSGSRDSELSGCIIFDNGWDAPDRGHGHAIYTQNAEGVKTISDCMMTAGHGYSLHAYGSSKADVDNYLLEGNVCFQTGNFLVGGGKPSHGIKVIGNFLWKVSMQLGYSAPFNEDCEVRDNVILDGGLTINKFKQVLNEGNLVLAKGSPHPATNRVILRPNRYEPRRAHLIVFRWENDESVRIDTADFLKKGDAFRLLNPRDLFGKPILEGRFDGTPISLAQNEQFGAYVLLRDR